MLKYTFADRYSEAGLQPTAELIALREAISNKIAQEAKSEVISRLIQYYFGSDIVEMEWFRDEFRANDGAFSLVNNKREAIILAALILEKLIDEESNVAILGVVSASFGGLVKPSEAAWLVEVALNALQKSSSQSRVPVKPITSVKLTQTPKIVDEIATAASGDWAVLPNILTKMRTETFENLRVLGQFGPQGFEPVHDQILYMREENQILWWLIGETSRLLKKPFGTLTPDVAAVVAGFEMAQLSTASVFGPIAAPAVLDRVIRLAKSEKSKTYTLASSLNRLGADHLAILPINCKENGQELFPVMTAIRKIIENPKGWSGAFEKIIGVNADIEISPSNLASQIYYEHLLGQVI